MVDIQKSNKIVEFKICFVTYYKQRLFTDFLEEQYSNYFHI